MQSCSVPAHTRIQDNSFFRYSVFGSSIRRSILSSVLRSVPGSTLGSVPGSIPGSSLSSALRRIALGAALLMALCASFYSAPASAHAMLTKAEPARRAQLTQPPREVRLWFNEEVEKDYAALSVLHADKPVTDAKPRIAEDDPRSIILPMPDLAPGKYTVKFRVLSVDGHVVDSSYDFTVKSKAAAK